MTARVGRGLPTSFQALNASAGFLTAMLVGREDHGILQGALARVSRQQHKCRRPQCITHAPVSNQAAAALTASLGWCAATIRPTLPACSRAPDDLVPLLGPLCRRLGCAGRQRGWAA